VSVLKSAKARAKANFTRARNQLLRLLDDEVVIRPIVRSAQDKLTDTEVQVIEAIENLNSLVSENSNESLKLQSELDTLEMEFSAAMQQAENALARTSTSQSTIIPSDVISSIQSAEPTSVSQVSQSSTRSDPGHISLSQYVSTMSTTPTFVTQSAVATGGVFTSPSQQHGNYGNSYYPPATASSVGQDIWRQLKRVSIPMFSGDKRNYESWKAAFIACIDSAPMSAEYKLLQLRQYLAGEALRTIENLGHSAASYEAAKERLERKFGGTRRHIALQLDAIDKFRPIRPGNANDFEKFADLLDLTLINLQEAGRYDELGNGSLYHKLVQKLDVTLITSYQRWLFEQQKCENVESLRQFVNQEAEFRTIASEAVHGISSIGLSSQSHTRRSAPSAVGMSYFGNNTTASSCECCGGSHRLWKCQNFAQMDVADRWQLAKDKKLCFRCLGSTHNGSTCSRSRPCGLDGCNRVHHRLLHGTNNSHPGSRGTLHSSTSTPNQTSLRTNQTRQSTSGGQPMQASTRVTAAAAPDNTDQRQENITMTSSSPYEHIALRTVPVIVRNGRKSVKINALLDDGSTKTYLNADVAAELGITGENQHVTVCVLNGQNAGFDTTAVDVELLSLDGRITMTVNAFTTDKVTGSMKAVD